LAHFKYLLPFFWLEPESDPCPTLASNRQAAIPIAALFALRLEITRVLSINQVHRVSIFKKQTGRREFFCVFGSLGISVVEPRIWGASVRTHARTPNPAPFTAKPEDPCFL